jgi:hypothetical protein
MHRIERVGAPHAERNRMGFNYTSMVVVGSTDDEVGRVLDGRTALISPADDGAVFVFPAQRDAPDSEPLAGLLSSRLGRPVLEAIVFESDMLNLTVLVDGTVGTWTACPPGIFANYDLDDPPDMSSVDEFASESVRLLGRGDVQRLSSALATFEGGAEDVHETALAALDLPAWAARWDYGWLRAETPELPCGPLRSIG